MRNAFALAGAAVALVLSAGVSAQAGGDVATRCNSAGCDKIRCDFTGDQCVRFSSYDDYYNGYTNGDDNGYYGGYAGNSGGYGPYYGSGPTYGNGFAGPNGTYGGYGSYPNGYYGGYGGYYGGYGAQLVCDRSGARCYRSSAPYWSYREYYRLHGYHWDR
jgi:hypothetical protein